MCKFMLQFKKNIRRSNMKKISSVILCLILCLNIVGCSSNPAANTSSQISSQENEESNTARSLHFSLEKQGVDINIL